MRSYRSIGRAVGCAVVLAGLAAGGSAAAQTADVPPPPRQAATWFETLTWPVQAVGSWLGGWLQYAETAVVAERRAFTETLKSDLARFETLVGEAGFKVSEVLITGGLSPEISLTLEVRRDISDEEEAALRRKIIADTDGPGLIGTIERTLLLALLDVDEAAESVRPDGYSLSELEVDIDLFPGFSYHFTPVGE